MCDGFDGRLALCVPWLQLCGGRKFVLAVVVVVPVPVIVDEPVVVV